MLLSFEALKEVRGKVAMVDGGFDPIHLGHVLYFREALKQGYPVFCNVSSDAYVAAKHKVLLPQDVRCQVIDEFKSVSYVHPSSRSTAEVLAEVRPRAYVKGRHWAGRLPAEELKICTEYDVKVVFVDTIIDSSSKRVKALMDSQDIPQQIASYERFVQKQKATASEAFDKDYFHTEWRGGDGGNYTIAERRRLEARNPELIREVFKAKTVLDMGCGPGALMFLLHELGVEADGVDFAEASKELAPPEVRDRIRVGSATDIDLPTDSYELVICREVMEHMTVLQVQKTVENICRISSRFVYVTTRFHPNPTSLFDVTTEFDVDPTHITLMHIEMLRLMFILQGFARRTDLEQKMDWLNKGRVLVYEKIR